MALTATTIAAAAGADAGREYAVTVYSQLEPGAVNPATFQQQIANPDYRQRVPGYAIVRTRTQMGLDRGVTELAFTDVAAGLDPTTVKFESLTDPEDTHVLEQSFVYDLASSQRVLDRYVDQEIQVDLLHDDELRPLNGRLMAARNGDLLLQVETGELISVFNGPRNIRFPALPEGLITRPTLQWQVAADRRGEHEVQLTYETDGMTWWTDYTLVQSDEQGCQVDVSAWVSLVNQSGASYDGATLKLVAGDVNRAQPARPQSRSMAMDRMEVAAASPEGFAEKSFFEYHLYTLGRPVDLPDRALKQLELFKPATAVPCARTLYVGPSLGTFYGGDNPFVNTSYPGGAGRGSAEVFLSFDNDEASGLGLPLPRGRVRVSRRDPDDGALEFIGEDTIDHTPRNETVDLRLGEAFDVRFERVQKEFRWNKAQQWMEETIDVTLTNRKETDETIRLDERLYRWSNWEILKPTHEFEQRDAATIRFEVAVPADAQVTVRYTARYTW